MRNPLNSWAKSDSEYGLSPLECISRQEEDVVILWQDFELCEYAKTQQILPFKGVNFLICELLSQ